MPFEHGTFRVTSLTTTPPRVGPYASGPMVIPRGWVFLMSEVPLYLDQILDTEPSAYRFRQLRLDLGNNI